MQDPFDENGVPNSTARTVWDTEEFFSLLQDAEQGNAEAQCMIANSFYFGEGLTQQDYKKAVEWWSKAAEQEYAPAQYVLGIAYIEGKGAPQDYKTAIQWLQKSAEQGNQDAQIKLGWLYYNGEGIPQNYETAAHWFRKAAEQGNALAQCNMGAMYHEGKGVPQNYETAAEWYRKSAEQGYDMAKKLLEEMRNEE